MMTILGLMIVVVKCTRHLDIKGDSVMLQVSKINGRVWLKVFNDTGLIYSDGDFQSIGEAMVMAADYLK